MEWEQLLTLMWEELGFQGMEEQARMRTGDEFLLNVGGKIFATTKDTLCSSRYSKLTRMVRGEDKQQFDKDGNLFIDANPKYFSFVLDGLRKPDDNPYYLYKPWTVVVPTTLHKSVCELDAKLGVGNTYQEKHYH